ncbi:PLAA [Cordylochernes scorpioides]|uniref:PLAA n=1 Tax=Cordylochernes scorpioides TaxID=51811 RepID=A0ABY6LFG3_9ARAC|nr:PLAA [Cordylochernes scorpioides]
MYIGIETITLKDITVIFIEDTPDNQVEDTGFTESYCLTGPTNYVACVCSLPPSDQHPYGLILVGCHDSAIYGLAPETNQPAYKLLGHNGPANTSLVDTSPQMCSLAAGTYGTVVSGSWDGTARVWLGQKCMLTLEGHQGSVWAVAIFAEQGLMLTGSADKTIRLWRAGKCERVFYGHEDCVRGLATLSTQEFLSCSNDTTIRHWQTTGSCLRVIAGHNNYVYSICTIPGEMGFVTCGEDHSLKVWSSQGECVQTLRLPVPTLWSVACLENGDIVVGASDGNARVFSQIPELQAPPEVQLAYEEEIAKSALPMGEIGDLKVDQLPGPSALREPGTRDGQTLIIRDGDKVTVHNWVAADKRWMKVGDVVGGEKGEKPVVGGGENKVWFEGKEYDYVFTVDVEAPKPLKLPYNVGEDPWVTAQNFIHKHNLSQLFLDQIANFIVQNTKGTAAAPVIAPTTTAPNTGCDPFTGAGRYIPGTATQTAPPPQPVAAPEPVKEEGHDNHAAPNFPLSTYIRFENANVDGITCKLTEFNQRVKAEEQLTDRELQEMLTLVHPVGEPSDLQLAALEKAIHWPQDFVFPSLDLLRLAVRGAALNERVCKLAGLSLTNHLLSYLDNGPSPPANKMLALRTLCNLFSHPPGEELLLRQYERVLNTALTCAPTTNKNIQTALSTLTLNYAVAFYNRSGTPTWAEAKHLCVGVSCQLLPHLNEPEAQYRLMVALGTLMWKDQVCVGLGLSLQLPQILQKIKPSVEKLSHSTDQEGCMRDNSKPCVKMIDIHEELGSVTIELNKEKGL